MNLYNKLFEYLDVFHPYHAVCDDLDDYSIEIHCVRDDGKYYIGNGLTRKCIKGGQAEKLHECLRKYEIEHGAGKMNSNANFKSFLFDNTHEKKDNKKDIKINSKDNSVGVHKKSHIRIPRLYRFILQGIGIVFIWEIVRLLLQVIEKNI